MIVCKAYSGPFSSQNLMNKFIPCFLVETIQVDHAMAGHGRMILTEVMFLVNCNILSTEVVRSDLTLSTNCLVQSQPVLVSPSQVYKVYRQLSQLAGKAATRQSQCLTRPSSPRQDFG